MEFDNYELMKQFGHTFYFGQRLDATIVSIDEDGSIVTVRFDFKVGGGGLFKFEKNGDITAKVDNAMEVYIADITEPKVVPVENTLASFGLKLLSYKAYIAMCSDSALVVKFDGCRDYFRIVKGGKALQYLNSNGVAQGDEVFVNVMNGYRATNFITDRPTVIVYSLGQWDGHEF